MSRVERINELLKRSIAEILTRKIADSRIGFVSILEVRVTKDLSQAWVYYSQIGSTQDKLKTKRGLRSATGYIRGELGKDLRLQNVPNLTFEYDSTVERGSSLIDKINSLSDE